VDDGRLPGIGRRAVIKLPAQIDDPHCISLPCRFGFGRTLSGLWDHDNAAITQATKPTRLQRGAVGVRVTRACYLKRKWV
jgi:hypothetical protein